MSVTCVVGGQFGSEGKGAVVAKIARQHDIHVRVGAANAGHTFYDDEGFKHVVQQIPVAAYAHPDALLCLGPGALISWDVLEAELKLLDEWRTRRNLARPRIHIDWRAHVITPGHIEREQQSDLAARIGSTSTIAREGIGAAQAARVMREDECLLAMDHLLGASPYTTITDVPAILNRKGAPPILLEGTQGTGLSLTTGPFPYVTSRNTTAAGLAADCGVGPRSLSEIIVVMRTFPIRVAGNSGPFAPGSIETSFDEIGVEPETTTVTKLTRRVADFSVLQAKEACEMNSATKIALTFCDYIAPALANQDPMEVPESMLDDPEFVRLWNFIANVEDDTGVPIWMLGTGPDSYHFRDSARHALDAAA